MWRTTRAREADPSFLAQRNRNNQNANNHHGPTHLTAGQDDHYAAKTTAIPQRQPNIALATTKQPTPKHTPRETSRVEDHLQQPNVPSQAHVGYNATQDKRPAAAKTTVNPGCSTTNTTCDRPATT